jgi:diguanylate cyclase (GGDEF)-like protein
VGHAAILSGVCKLTGNGSAWKLVLFTALGSCVFQSIPAVAESLMLRLYVLYPFLIALYCTGLVSMWKDKNSPYRKAYIPLAIVFTFYILQSILRSFIAVARDLAMEFLGNDIIQTSGTLAIIVLFFSLTVCFALTVSWRKEIDLRKQAITDHLTGWLNRSTLNITATRVLNECKRSNTQTAFIMLDIDNFKSINDRFGHSAGDRCIQHVGEITQDKLRNYDHCFRLGGEEFLVIIKNTKAEVTENLSERIRRAVEQTPVHIAGNTIDLTVSIGIALSSPDARWNEVLENADNALYLAKNSGRNRVAEHRLSTLTQATNLPI